MFEVYTSSNFMNTSVTYNKACSSKFLAKNIHISYSQGELSYHAPNIVQIKLKIYYKSSSKQSSKNLMEEKSNTATNK